MRIKPPLFSPGGAASLALALALGLAVLSGGALHKAREALGANETVAVIDGDTLQMGADIVQLYGIDAPELGQLCRHDTVWNRCGLEAAYQLDKLLRIALKEIKCDRVTGAPDRDAQGHLLRECRIGETDPAEALLSGGYVVVAEQTSFDYQKAEKAAKEATLGLWRAPFVMPADWRDGQRLPGETGEPRTAESGEQKAAAKAAQIGCPIKALGEGSAHGAFYVPTDKIYESIEIDPARGDRMLCSDEAAFEGGWVRSRRD